MREVANNEQEKNGNVESDHTLQKKRQYRKRREERYKFTDSSDEEYKPRRPTLRKISDRNVHRQRRISDQISSSFNKIVKVFRTENEKHCSDNDMSDARSFQKNVEGQCCCAAGGGRCRGIPEIANKKISKTTHVRRTSRHQNEVTVTKFEPPMMHTTPSNNESNSSCDCQVCKCSEKENSVYRASKRQENLTVENIESPVARTTTITSFCDCQKCECSDDCEVITKDTCLICRGNCKCIDCSCSKDGRDLHYSSCDCSLCKCSALTGQSSQGSSVVSTDHECDPCECVECSCTESKNPLEDRIYKTDTSNQNNLQSINSRKAQVSDTSDQDGSEIHPVDECRCVTCDCSTDDSQSDATSFDTNYESSNKSFDNRSRRKKIQKDSESNNREKFEDIREDIRKRDLESCEYVCCHKEPGDGVLKTVCPCYDLNEKYNEEVKKNERPGCCRRFFSCCFGSKKDKARAKSNKTESKAKPKKEKPVKNRKSGKKPKKEKAVQNKASRQKPRKVKVVEKQEEKRECCLCCCGPEPKKEETYQRKTPVKENVCRRKASQKNGEYKECPRGHVKALPDPKLREIRESSTRRDGSMRPYGEKRNESPKTRTTTNHRDEKKSSGCCGCCGGNESKSKKKYHERSKKRREVTPKRDREQKTRKVKDREENEKDPGKKTETPATTQNNTRRMTTEKPTRSCRCSGGIPKPLKKKSGENCHCNTSKIPSQYKSRRISEKIDNKNGLNSRAEQITYTRCQQKLFLEPSFQVLKCLHTNRRIQTEPMRRFENDTSFAKPVQEREVMQVNFEQYLPVYDKLTRSRYNTLKTLIETSGQVVTGNTRGYIEQESCVKLASSNDGKSLKHTAHGEKEETKTCVRRLSRKRHNKKTKRSIRDSTDQGDGKRNMGGKDSESNKTNVKIQREHICRKMLDENIKVEDEERKNVSSNSSTRFISDSLACSSMQVPLGKRINPNTNIQVGIFNDGISPHKIDMNPTKLGSEMTLDHSYVTLITTLPHLGKSPDKKDQQKKISQEEDRVGSDTMSITRDSFTLKDFTSDIEPKRNECIKRRDFHNPRPRLTDAYMNTINLGVEKSVQTESKMINEEDTSLTPKMLHRPLLHLQPALDDDVMSTATKYKPLSPKIHMNAFYVLLDKNTQTDVTCDNIVPVTLLRKKSNEKGEIVKREVFVDADEEVVTHNYNYTSTIKGECVTHSSDSVETKSDHVEREEKECGDGNYSNFNWNINLSARAFAERDHPGHNEHCTSSPLNCEQAVIEQRSATDSSISNKSVDNENINLHNREVESSARKSLSTTFLKKLDGNQSDGGNINGDSSVVGTQMRCRSHKSFREFRRNNKISSPTRRKTRELDPSKTQESQGNAEQSVETSEEISESQSRRCTRDEARTEHTRQKSVDKLKKSMDNSKSQSEMNSFRKISEPLKRLCSNVFHAAGISTGSLGTRSWSNVMKDPFYTSGVTDKKSKQVVRKKSSNEYHHRDIGIRNRRTWDEIRDEHEKREKEKEGSIVREKRKSSVGMPNHPRRYTWEDVKRDHCKDGFSKNKTRAAPTLKPRVTSIKRQRSVDSRASGKSKL